MERREFLKIALGVAAGAAALAASVQAAPLMPQPLTEDPKLPANPAVTSTDEADQLKPEEVRWGRGRRWGYRRRHWGWRRRRHWGWRRRRWRRRYWGWHRRRRWHRRRYWRRRYW
jgi:hypothetical protein